VCGIDIVKINIFKKHKTNISSQWEKSPKNSLKECGDFTHWALSVVIKKHSDGT